MHAFDMRTQAGQIKHYAAIKARLYGPTRRQKPVLTVVPKAAEPPPVPKPVIGKAPQWMRTEVRFDAHVQNWQWHLTSQWVKPSKRYLILLAEKFCIPYSALTGATRKKPVITHRLIAMYVLRHEYGCSYPDIGRLLGGRDHSTTYSGVRKIERLISEGLDISEYRRSAVEEEAA